jgi:NADH:ubiquinone oxidoreductase subunit F (NADH-binding)
MSENLSQLSARKGLTDNLFEAIVRAKGDPLALKELAKKYKTGEANLYAASSAYDFIQGDNANKKAYLCNGSSCLCAGTQGKVKDKLLTQFSEHEIGHVTCLGRCHENASFQIAGKNYSGSDYLTLSELISQPESIDQSKSSQEDYSVHCTLEKPILTETIGDVSTYYALLSQLIENKNKTQLIEEVIASGLRGRGGAGFPTGIKWQSCANESCDSKSGDEKYIVCNADEGDPGAFSDRYLMEQRPHAVLFGMLLAGYMVGAEWGVLYIRDEYPDSVETIQKAIEQFEALNLLPNGFNFQFKIIRGAGAYICGEETALLRSIEGQKPMVSVRPPYPTVKGLFGKPTVINNVETFAAIHWILENSPQAYAALNNAATENGRSTGSKLLSLDSSFNKPGIFEVPMGEKLSKVIELAGGFSKPIKALHIGGPLGGLIPLSKISNLTIDFESFANAGFLLGHAGIIGIPESFNIAKYVQHLFEFTEAESCGKCFPCRLGATRGKEMFKDALNQTYQLDRELLNDLLETMEKGSLCALGGGVPLPVKNALEYFSDELDSLFNPISHNLVSHNHITNRIPVLEKNQ